MLGMLLTGLNSSFRYGSYRMVMVSGFSSYLSYCFSISIVSVISDTYM